MKKTTKDSKNSKPYICDECEQRYARINYWKNKQVCDECLQIMWDEDGNNS